MPPTAGDLAVRAIPTCQRLARSRGPGTRPPLPARFVAFAAEREPAVDGLLDQPVDEQRAQGAIALCGVGQPGHVEFGTGDGRVVAAQHIQQAPADLTVGARVALGPGVPVSSRPGSRADRHAHALNGQMPQRGARAVHTVAPSSISATEKLRCLIAIRAAARRRHRGHG